MRAALQRPDLVAAPPELNAYRIARAFWEKLGVREVDLRHWPTRKIAQFIVMMNVEDEVDAERQQTTTPAAPGSGAARARPGAPQTAGGDRAAATEEAFQRMRAQATPPPMPPPT